MITLLIGENSFEIERYIGELKANFKGDVEKINGNELQLAQLPDIFMGVSLFSINRMIIIRNLSENKSIWSIFGDWLPKISSDINLVIVESKPDKRTSTFKSFKKHADIKEFNLWSDRDVSSAEKWVSAEAKKLGLVLDNNSVQLLVQRVGLDQWQLLNALQKLLSVDVVSVDVIKEVIDANPIENVFDLLDAALRSDVVRLKQILQTLEQSEDVYRLSSLLFTQAFQLAVVSSADKLDNTAKDFAIHPYVVSKLEPIAKRIGKAGVFKVISIFAQADDDMKMSRAEPWLLVERALVKVANI